MVKKKKGYTPKITPIKALKLKKIFIKLGFEVLQGRGSHIVVTGKKIPFPIAFGNHPSFDLSAKTVKILIKKAKISKKQYLDAFNSI